MPDLHVRLARARAAAGVLELRDVRIWRIDDETATGSLVVIARNDADVQATRRSVVLALGGGPLNDVTVQVERDEDESDWIEVDPLRRHVGTVDVRG